MTYSPRWMFICLVLPALIVVAGMAAAFDLALASPDGGGERPTLSFLFKDDDDDEDDDDKSGSGGDDHDNSGHGNGDDDRDDHDDDDDRHGDVARPMIPADQLGDVVVEIVDEQFVPATFSLEAGQRVTFINLDDDEHTGTGLGFDTGKLDPGEWATVTMTKTGEVPFVCQYHSEMQGTITVAGDATPVASPMSLELTPVGTPAAEGVTVDIVDFAFSEAALTVPAGTTVTWVNQDQVPHTVTGPFGDSGALQAGESFSFTFGEPGTFDYVCQFHPNMTAQVVVT